MLKNNEKGLSLVEVLAVIVIGSIVMIFMFNLIVSGMNNSNQIKERASVQNEANYLLVVFREFHERGDNYQYYLDGDILVIEDLTSSKRTEFNKFKYRINGGHMTINPKSTDIPIEIDITISSEKYPNISTEVKTKLHRL